MDSSILKSEDLEAFSGLGRATGFGQLEKAWLNPLSTRASSLNTLILQLLHYSITPIML